MNVLCDYCGNPAQLVTGKQLYPHRPDLADKKLYQCKPCNAWVACHTKTTKPLGRLANPELQMANTAAHNAFYRVWLKFWAKKKKKYPNYNRIQARDRMYERLADLMGLERKDCHIGMFDVDQCHQVVQLCNAGALND